MEAPSEARHFDTEGNEIFPCRCGETHKGDYGLYDFMHHNCFHDAPLWSMKDDPGHFVCGACGKSFFTLGRFDAS